jgi:hypothetical protein
MAQVTKKVSRKSKAKAPAPKVKKPALRGEKASTPKRLDEKALIERYPHVVARSLQFNEDGPYAGKQTVKIKCATTGCRTRREVATSDLFQVTRCRPHTLDERKARRAEARAAKAA